ncbi:porin [Malikia spinosa]|uniref:porin n=1 Tax=Malikia spinosa TaxID=86180 RepID=UPI0027B99495|nr:porin [Malikia spinosa]
MSSRKYVIAALSLASIGANQAIAQSAPSSVAMFGIVDINFRSVKNGDQTIKQVASNGMSPSQFGFRGTEDLGDGLQAGFWLEGAFFPDTGATDPAKFFGRRSTISLAGSFGEVRLGRDQAPGYRNIATFDPFGNVGLGSGLTLVSSLGSGASTLVRTDNAVAYFLPPIMTANCTHAYRECGLYGHISMAAGEGIKGGEYRGGRLGYAVGAVNVAVGMASTKTATTDDFKVKNFGASYDFTQFKLMGLYNESKWGARTHRVLGLGATVPVGQFLLRATMQRADASGVGTDANDARQWAIGSTYSLSKRTSLYGTYGHISNSGAAAFAVGTLPAASLATGKISSGYEFGLRHAF